MVMDQITASQPITSDTLVLQVVESYPQTIAVFNDLHMACPGCHVSPFHTIADSAREYGLHSDELLQALNDALTSNAV
jgi:hybrid cluster-associated redox disulfide protein